MFSETYRSVLEAYEKFWNRENTDRCTLNLTYKITDSTPYRDPVDLEEKWLNENYILDAYRHRIANIGCLAEGMPSLVTNLGPGCLAACLGSSYTLNPRTIWFEETPQLTDWENPTVPNFDTQSEMWGHITRLQAKFAQDPNVLFAMTDLGGILDIVASLRGTEALLYDLYDYPDEVRTFTRQVKDIWLRAFHMQAETIHQAGLPYTTWMNIPSSKPWYPLQCDFCYMISPTQFAQFVLPDLIEQSEAMPRSIYHLDGVGELPHLDMILDIPGINGIQWTAGPGQPPLWDPHWFDLYRKIQDKQKNLVLLGGLSGADTDDIERLIKTLDPTGLYITRHCSSRETAEDLLEKITRWSE